MNITYELSIDVTDATVMGLPAGVTGNVNGNIFEISGSPIVPGSFSYSITTTGSCIGTVGGTITVDALPVATLVSSDNIFCLGSPVTFTAGGGVSYIFRVNGVIVQTGTSNIYTTSSLTNGQIVDVVVTNSEGCSSNSPAITNIVNPLPVATATNNGPVCVGTLLSLTGGPSGMYLYSWTGPNGFALQSQVVSLSATMLMAGTYTLTVTDAGGCKNSASTIVTVNPLPTASATNNGPVCAGTPLALTGGPASMSAYAWTGPGGYISAQQSPVISETAALAMAGFYTLTVTNINGCQRTATTAVTVYPPPVATAASNGPVCAGTPLRLAGGPSGMTKYSWSGPNGFISDQQSPTVSTAATPGMSGIYTLTVTNSNGCIGEAATSAVVNALPVATAVNNGPVCSGTPLILTGWPDGMRTYNWSGPDGFVSDLQSPTVSAMSTIRMSGIYTLTVTDLNGCSGTGSTIAVVNQSPAATASNNGPLCAGSILALEGGPALFTYAWTGPNGFTSTLASPVVSGSATTAMSGIYLLTVTGATGCRDTASTHAYVYDIPVAYAGTGGTECDLDFVLNAVPGIGTGLWSVVTGPGTATFAPNAATPTATVTVSLYGTYSFMWTETNGPCVSTSVVTVNFYRPPVANAGAGGNECDQDFVLGAVPSSGLGTWSMTAGTGTATFEPDANAPGATVHVTDFGTKVFTWIESNGVCADTSEVTVNFSEQPVANAGTGGNNCGLNFNLEAIPSVGIGTWTMVSGPGAASFTPDANTPTGVVSVTQFGTYVLRWTEVNGTCTSSSDITVNFIMQPPARGGNGGIECDLDFALNAELVSGTGTWRKVNGPGNAVFSPDASHPDALVTVDQFGSYDFSWTVVNSECSSSDIIRVIFNDVPQVSAGKDEVICKGRSIQLNATGTGLFLWSPANLLSNPRLASPVATPSTTTTFTVTLTDPVSKCSNSDQMIVEVRTQPVAYAGQDQVLEYTFDATLDATPPGVDQTGEWTVLEGKGDFSDISDPKATVSHLSLNLNRFIWTVTNQVCPVSSDTVGIFVHDLIIPTLITPNLDGINDFFVIKGMESIGKVTLTVFNRWGAMVYRNENYDNRWDGVDENNNPLQDDTYFFILEDEKIRTIKGYIVIRR
ncbi:MAG: gliding motility-associated C-terminal domain-containing protein [Bacteroidales bacterium]